MARNIFRVEAWIVDGNGTFNILSGYPKNFDSKSYNDDVAKALKRAQGDLSEVWGAFCKRDDRQVQTVILTQANGQMIERKSMGNFIEETPEEEIIEQPVEPSEP